MIFIYFRMIRLLSYLHLEQYQDVSSTAEANVKRKKKNGDEYIQFVFLSTKIMTLSIYYVSFVGCSCKQPKIPSYRGKKNTKIVFSKVFNKKYKKFNSAKNPCMFWKKVILQFTVSLIDSLSIWIWCVILQICSKSRHVSFS